MRRAFLVAATLVALTPDATARPRWKKIAINDQSPYEAAGVADIDGDGDLDIFSGAAWYEAPRWTRHQVREVTKVHPKYHEDFGNMPLDVNADGKIDFVTCSFFGKLLGWIEHPGDPTKPWTTHEIERPGASEACRLIDLNGDGRPELLPATNNVVAYYELTASQPPKWEKRVVGKLGAGHGIGVGDIDADGRLDLVGPFGWYQQPAKGSPAGASWTFHQEFKLGGAGILILGRDVDGDGLTDVVSGNGHDYGLFWLRQGKSESGARTWTREEIDTQLSSVHTLLWVDLDGRGEPALVTGKRVYAHEIEPGDVDASQIAAFRFDRRRGKWQKEVIFQGQPARNAPAAGNLRDALKDFPRGTAGTGLDIAAADLDRDGDLDLVCPGKSGLYVFQNPRLARKK